jgi:hypothetical protein
MLAALRNQIRSGPRHYVIADVEYDRHLASPGRSACRLLLVCHPGAFQ